MTYPRVRVIRSGPNAGKVFIQWSERGTYCIVGPDGVIEDQYRIPAQDILWSGENE